MSIIEHVTGEDVTVLAADGRALAARLFTPEHPSGPAVLIAGATGVPQRYYRSFAGWIAGQGATALTIDYRGIGASRHPQGVRRDLATMREWGSLDLNAALDFLIGRDPSRPVAVVGHSAGGWLLSMAPNAQLVAAILTVSSQNGYWKQWTGLTRLARFAQWHIGVPLLARTAGALPAAAFGGEPLPRGVALDWARWGRRPEFIDGDDALPRERRFAGQLLAIGIPDDPYAPRTGVEWLPTLYPKARSTVHVLPDRYRHLGHFGAFRPDAHPLWAQGWSWLTTAAAAA